MWRPPRETPVRAWRSWRAPKAAVRWWRRSSEKRGALFARQLETAENLRAHCRTTALEIWEDRKGRYAWSWRERGQGALTGIGGALKELNPSARVVTVGPEHSSDLSGGRPGR